MKVKAKMKGDVVSTKVLIKHPNLTYDQAKKKKTEANFITHISAKCNDKVVFDMSSSQFLSKNPLIKFKFKGAKAGDKVEVTWVDLKGNTKTKAGKIK
jgi:sulfur-oxidizing protein SoxZ